MGATIAEHNGKAETSLVRKFCVVSARNRTSRRGYSIVEDERCAGKSDGAQSRTGPKVAPESRTRKSDRTESRIGLNVAGESRTPKSDRARNSRLTVKKSDKKSRVPKVDLL